MKSPTRANRWLWQAVIFLVIIGVAAVLRRTAHVAPILWNGGVNQAASTTLFGAFFPFCFVKALRHIRRREIALHREWMIRAFSASSSRPVPSPV